MAKLIVKDVMSEVAQAGFEAGVAAVASLPNNAPKKKEIKSYDGRIAKRYPAHRTVGLTNDEYSVNPDFNAACEAAGIKATARQASKYRMGKGLAYANRNHQKTAA